MGGDTNTSYDETTSRTQLACFHCREKRIRCSGTRPVCSTCAGLKLQCTWPAGRRRRRTRREMEEAKQRQEQKTRIGQLHQFNAAPTTASAETSTSPLSTFKVWGATAEILPPPPPTVPPTSAGGNSASENASSASAASSALPIATFAGFLTQSPGTDVRLLDDLNRTAYLADDGSSGEALELFYYRLSGSTAINPGIHRISLKLRRRPGSLITAEPIQEEAQTKQSPRLPQELDLFDGNNLPHRAVWETIFDQFLTHMSALFPSVSRQRMMERYDSGTMSAFLANSICALGARFQDGHDGGNLAACAPFIAKAEQLVVPLLHLPAHDVCSGLLLLAWASYGHSSEAGLWQYTGMAIRMATDLGMHEKSHIYESAQHLVRTRRLFWSLFITDAVVAMSTGRSTTIDVDTVEIPFPEDEDFFPDPSRDAPSHPSFSPGEPVQPVAFVYLVRLMVVTARIANVLNGRRWHGQPQYATQQTPGEQLSELQTRLISFYSTLPDAMRWSAENFKIQLARGHGTTFLTLHLWSHAVLALVCHPILLRPPSAGDNPFCAGLPHNARLASLSARQISECLVFADLVSHTSYTGSPLVVQPLFIAAMALVHDMAGDNMTETGTQPSDVFVATVTKQNLSVMLRAIARTEGYWAGASYVAKTLEERTGIPRSRPSAMRGTYISLPDNGLLRRFEADPRHPANITPPTETSLQNSMARDQGRHSEFPMHAT